MEDDDDDEDPWWGCQHQGRQPPRQTRNGVAYPEVRWRLLSEAALINEAVKLAFTGRFPMKRNLSFFCFFSKCSSLVDESLLTQNMLIHSFFLWNYRDEEVHCLDNIQLVTPYQKAEILVAQARITEWGIATLRQLLLPCRPLKGRAQPTLLHRMPWARYAYRKPKFLMFFRIHTIFFV